MQRLSVLLLVIAQLGCGTTVPRPSEVASPRDKRGLALSWTKISGYSTTFRVEQADRNHNIAIAAAQLNGQVIPAGGSWSFNQAVGARTLQRGYRIAPVLALEGAVLAEGGGVCQVSTTLYNVALLADLTALERHPHSRPIHYVPLGRDATVSWGTKDLKLKNRHPFPVRMQASVVHNRLLITIYATERLDYEVRLETADAEHATPRRELQMLEHPDELAVGGVWIKLYLHRLRAGSVYESERVGRSSFYPWKIKPEER